MNFLNAFDGSKAARIAPGGSSYCAPCASCMDYIYQWARRRGAITPPPRGAWVCCAVGVVHVPLPPSLAARPPWAVAENRGGSRLFPYR